ncbi:tRNA epoxyqueuosine(34) reductase QueG [Dehalococcoidia bacterium]|nr:tRNA epoxyqueuosine(34) reductase QueG [Dehalococcoidia bacterium]
MLSGLEEKIKSQGKNLGFDLVSIATAEPFYGDELEALKRIRDGHMDGLSWYTEDRVRKMNRPGLLLEGAKSIISVGVSYLEQDGESEKLLSGRVSRYARGADYHSVLKLRLRKFRDAVSDILGKNLNTRIFVDDGPMNDKGAARRSGLGWMGKNTNILTPTHGSWIFLGQLILDVALKPDIPLKKTCGNCTKCIDDCPTGAIVAPYVVDNSRCISYLTIELKGSIPIHLRPLMGDWIFGCDICQDVCPVNKKAEMGKLPEFKQRPGFSTPSLVEILNLDQETFSKVYKGSPIKRAKLAGLKRNACVALGNNGDAVAIKPLSRVLFDSPAVVRGHAAWALGRLGGPESEKYLRKALVNEDDVDIRCEIQSALDGLGEHAQIEV